MGMLNNITKEVFEANVPAAKMPERNSSVFDRLEKMLSVAYETMIRTIVSPDCEASIDDDSELYTLCQRMVCLDAFVRTCRSLDLVLTATGFGIVSTESTAPASKVRVDALIEEMACERLAVLDKMLPMLAAIDGWGATAQASLQMPTLFCHPQDLRQYTTLPFSSQNWQTAKGRAVTADALLRQEISDEYMDELLAKTRTSTLTNADIIVVEKCNRFTGDFLSHYDVTKGLPNVVMLRLIVHQLESYRDSYPTYCNSKLYARRHAERYKNQKEDPSFFFM